MKIRCLARKNSAFIFRAAVLILVVTAGWEGAERVRADGCFVAPTFVWNKAKDINEPTQKAILVYAAGQEDLILQVKYHGPVAEFGWLVSVPGRPTVTQGSMECFYELSRYTQEHWEPRSAPTSGLDAIQASLSAAGPGQPLPPVKVIEIKTVGAYEVAVLSPSDTGSLEKWLAANRFAYPPDQAEVIEDYVKRHWYFVAVKIDLAQAGGFQLVSGAPRVAAARPPSVVEKLSAGELPPLQLSFASEQCVFPLKISSVNGTPSEVQVYVLSPEPLVERTMFEQKFAELRPLAVKRNAQRIQLQENLRKTSLAFRQRFYPELGEEPGPPVETNLPMEMILKMGVPEELLLPYAAVSAKEFPECSRMISGFKGRDWWLTKQTWTFQPEEMRDLVFQPAAAVFLEDLAGDAGFYVAQNLVRLGPNAVPALVQALQSRNPRVRIHAAWVLNMMNGEETVTRDIRVLECLPVLFQDPEWEVRMEAARAAGGSWNPKFAEPIIHLLQDTNGGVAHSAVFALVRNSQGRAEHHAVLWAMLKDENLAVRANALEVLEAGRTPIPREAVLPLLGVPDMRMVSLAVRHLEQDGVGYQDLIPLLNNPERMARLTGLRVLGELADKEAVGVIIPLLRDPEPVVQKQAWTLLKTLTGQEIPRDQPRQWGQWWAEHRIPVLIAEDTKSIQLNSTHGEEYHMRGCLYYDSRQFAKARADFLKAGQLGADYPDYPHYRLWLIRARLGETAAATRELEAYLAARKTGQPGDWPSQVGRFLAGQVSEAEFLKAAKNPNAQTDREQQCEAWFYAGMKRLIAGEQTTATRYFKHCLGTGVENFEEYASARAELEFLAAKR